MTDYPAIFHLRVCRAMDQLKSLEAILEQMFECCQKDDNGCYKEITAVDLESLTILSDAIGSECQEAKRAMQWHKERQQQ